MKNNTTKVVKNYTAESEARLRSVYNPNAQESVRTAQIAQLAEELGKSTRSVIAKLSSMKGENGHALYVPKDPTVTKSVKRGPSRAEIVRNIESTLGLSRDALASLARSHRADLLKLAESVGTSTDSK